MHRQVAEVCRVPGAGVVRYGAQAAELRRKRGNSSEAITVAVKSGALLHTLKAVADKDEQKLTQTRRHPDRIQAVVRKGSPCRGVRRRF